MISDRETRTCVSMSCDHVEILSLVSTARGARGACSCTLSWLRPPPPACAASRHSGRREGEGTEGPVPVTRLSKYLFLERDSSQTRVTGHCDNARTSLTLLAFRCARDSRTIYDLRGTYTCTAM